jgi:hypothetical protein
MSNHSGSYLLNNIITIMDGYQIFDVLGREKTQQFVIEIVKKAQRQDDCNPGEILDGLGEKLGVCYYCLKPANEFIDGLCLNCYEPDDEEE